MWQSKHVALIQHIEWKTHDFLEKCSIYERIDSYLIHHLINGFKIRLSLDRFSVWLMVHGAWLKAHVSCLMPHGSLPRKAQRAWIGTQGPGLEPKAQGPARVSWPWACATRHEPLTINNRSINVFLYKSCIVQLTLSVYFSRVPPAVLFLRNTSLFLLESTKPKKQTRNTDKLWSSPKNNLDLSNELFRNFCKR